MLVPLRVACYACWPLGCILTHVRKMAREPLTNAVAKPTRQEVEHCKKHWACWSLKPLPHLARPRVDFVASACMTEGVL